MLLQILVFLILLTTSSSINALDFLFNSFSTSDLTLIQDAKVDSSVIRLKNDTNQFSIGRAFYPIPIPVKPNTNNNTQISSFSTSFIFSILPQITSSPGFGLAFVLSNSTSPPGAISGQYFGNSTVPTVSPLLAIEFDTGRNPEFNDPDENHVGIDLNNIESAKTQTAGYYNSSNGDKFVPVNMRNGQNIRAWIEFDGTQLEINVTIAPVGVSKPSKPLLTYRDPIIANHVSDQMFIGFSASKVTWIEPQRILAWSFSDAGSIARDINVTGLPVF
ncbi:L-type lectin-domain containing receptor kinase S.1-like [Papaver somniferum]|uniref:L-type lectin-domain containing receptor kinase S.1-like n=1 Tax=Papaver somniferum TaxID=3469 RepID=UPI000E705415|nr:L-type lectin-domain containing receptor kinase S.1-like [Papaver somniferum]